MSTNEKPFILVSIDSAAATDEAVDAESVGGSPDERVAAVDAELSAADVSTGGNTLEGAMAAGLAAIVTQYDETFVSWRKGIFTNGD